MTNVRLNKSMKEGALTKAVSEVFDEPAKQIRKRAQEFIQQIYQDTHKTDLIELKKLNTKKQWIQRSTLKLSFFTKKEIEGDASTQNTHTIEYIHLPILNTTSGCNTKHGNFAETFDDNKVFRFDKPMAWPITMSCNVELTKKKDIKKLLKLQQDCLALIEKRQQFKSELSGFLSACSTLSHVAANWPEGLKYFPEAPPKKLPIPLIDNVRDEMKKITASK